MNIVQLSIENFKKFKDKVELSFSNQNFFVGENNTGKTSVIDAINYLFSGPQKEKVYKNLKATEEEFINIEAVISGDFSNIDKKYQDYIFEKENVSYIKLKRSNEVKKITQSGKEVTLNESKILCWNEKNQQFENPAGKDTTFNLVEVVSIYANDHVDNIVSFDSSKILGKLIKNSVGNFFETDSYEAFKAHHNRVFNTGDESLKARLTALSADISSILKEQWGELELNFQFNLVDNSNHLKKGNVLVKEGDIEHSLEDKGSGFQRSTMLSMIQVLSKIHLSSTENNIILCIDEPELNLHPIAQEKLGIALSKLSENIQVIVSTHSPFMLKSFKKKSDAVYVFKDNPHTNLKKLDTLSVLPFGPTLAEIQYFAYNLTPNDLHNELYGYLESESLLSSFLPTKRWLDERRLKTYAKQNDVSIENIDEEIKESLKFDIHLQGYIRHSIHHPENEYNERFTAEEIKQSIDEMIQVIIKQS
jgi:predicted ATP-dependent endonuclease of OLD family